MFLWPGYVKRMFVLSETTVAQAARFASLDDRIGRKYWQASVDCCWHVTDICSSLRATFVQYYWLETLLIGPW